jgi:FkbM family methyltransferase
VNRILGRIRKLLLRALLSQPKTLLLLLHNSYRKFSGAEKITFDRDLNLFRIDTNPPFFFPHKKRMFLYRNGLSYRLEYLLDKYQLSQHDFIFSSIDLFIDCGSNIGELSRAILNFFQGDILCVDLEIEEGKCLKLNLPEARVRFLNTGLWFEDVEMPFQSSSANADSTLILSNSANITSLGIIQVQRLDRIVQELYPGANSICLKIETEGSEPEVLLGTIEILAQVKIITIDGGPERGVDKLETYLDCKAIIEENYPDVYEFSKNSMTEKYTLSPN